MKTTKTPWGNIHTDKSVSKRQKRQLKQHIANLRKSIGGGYRDNGNPK